MIQQNLQERRKKKLQKVVVVLRQEMIRILKRQPWKLVSHCLRVTAVRKISNQGVSVVNER